MDGSEFLISYKGEFFDLIFANTWPGKYWDIELALSLLKIGGFYIIDDMIPQENWPEGHAEKAENLISFLEERKDLSITKLNWSSGVIICTKIA